MYVQEYGSECRVPNQRCVYISYLDSVKYFDSKVEIVGGNAINSLVYQEILIGYLEYCKKQGFTSCYIWACPPYKDEDFILHCLPDSQREPKSDMLRQWYIGMLHKAMGKDIVMDYTNLYDRFFVSDVECKTKLTAAMLPYFDGNYWPSLLEDLIHQMCQEEEDGKRQNKKGKTKETTVESVLTVFDQSDPSTNASKDTLFLQKLGEIICGIKEEFIVVHLQHPCSHCRISISSRFIGVAMCAINLIFVVGVI